jgi:ribosomal protein S18 acetylase RimI-like enzyme
MAARIEAVPPAHPAHIVDLRRVTAAQMEPLLQEESAAWVASLDWDFEKSADLVRRFVELRALTGCALMERGEAAGYSYYVVEESKGLIGDLFMRAHARTVARENLLLRHVLDAIVATPSVRRVESQLMMIDSRPARLVPMREYLQTFERVFMRGDLRGMPLEEGPVRRPTYLERWSDHYQDAAAHLIASAYAGHVDSLINDQYRSVAGARRFLYNIVQYPGCGTFYRQASYAAMDAGTGRVVGISLASLVGARCGHITQICVAPGWRGTGVGHALLRQSLLTLRDLGCTTASLTVTASNEAAISLYERVGFATTRHFSAYVWEGF